VAVHRSFVDVGRTAAWLDQPASAIEIALEFYERHTDEIDEWIQENEAAAEEALRARRSAR